MSVSAVSAAMRIHGRSPRELANATMKALYWLTSGTWAKSLHESSLCEGFV
jgi:hypothetical protein